jgi:hypothetical protein
MTGLPQIPTKEPSAIANRSVAKIGAGQGIAAIIPTTIEEVFRLGELIAQSGLAPNGLKTPQAVTVVLMKGLEVGLPPMAALESFGVINGKACIYGDGIPALLWSNGFDIDEEFEGEGNKLVAICTVTRPISGKKISRRFSVEDAAKANLLSKDGPWKLYTARMCQMRARSWAARDGAADLLKGLKIYEEESDIERNEMRDITPREALLTPPDIPDIPDASPEVVSQDVPSVMGQSEVDAYIADLIVQRGYCNSEQDVRELAEGQEDSIAGLPPKAQQRAREILSIDEEF